MDIDVEQVRADTPACLEQAFLDAAGSALPSVQVVDTVIAHLRREAEVGGYVAMFEAEERIKACSVSLGRLVGLPASNIAIQTSATDAWMRGLQAIPLERSDRILTTRAEYGSNMLPMLQLSGQLGVSVEIIPDGPDGAADPSALGELLDDRVKVVAITHASSQNGRLVDAAAIGAQLRAVNSQAWYLLDACQSVGQVPVDVPGIGCDVLAATGRKFLRGPRGTGFLALSGRALAKLNPAYPDMFGSTWLGGESYESNPDASRFQTFEMSYAGLLGLGVAADHALGIGLPAIRERIGYLAQTLRSLLDEVPGVRVLDVGTEKTGIVVFATSDEDAGTRAAELRSQGITVVPVSRPTNPNDYDSYQSACVLRASPHIYNTEADLQALARALSSVRGS